MRINYTKIIFANIFILFTGILVLELFFGGWLKSNNYKNLLIPRMQKSILYNLPYESNNIGIFTRDKYGFRSNNYSLNEVDILIIGGSTTEEREVDDNLIWTKVFERQIINKKTLNAGIGGQTSYGHSKIYDIWPGC